MQQFIDWLPSQLGSEFARKVHGYNSKDWAQPYHGILAGELSHLKQLYTWSPSLEENRLYILHIYSLQTLLNYGDLVLHKRTSSLMGKFLKDLETRHTVILLPPSSSYSDEEPDVPRSDELKMRSEIPIAIKKQTSPEPSSIEATKDKDGSDDDKKGGKKVKPRFDGCYGSLADCETSTSKCFGHGKCTRSPLKHENDRSFTCFKCSCSPTVKTANGGNSTINWAGDMCQKKDVSVTFHILLFLTIALIIGVGAGVSLLYSIGGEELPGVLTAPPTSKRT